MQRPTRTALGASLAALALLLGITIGLAWRFLEPQPALRLPPGVSLEFAQLEALNALPGFALPQRGGVLRNADLQGRWSFFFFGYTNCPDACPTTLGILSHVQQELRSRGQEPPRVVLVSLDPQRDTPEVLERYTRAFAVDTADAVIGTSGTPEQLRALQAFFGVRTERRPGADPAHYSFDHTTNFFLVTPDGRWLASFPPAEDPDSILEDTEKLLALPLPAA